MSGAVVVRDVVLVYVLSRERVSGDVVLGAVLLVSASSMAIVSWAVVSRATVLVATVSRDIVSGDVVVGAAIRGGSMSIM